ncbi:MAG: GspMb/PilO family protein [Ilumatobacteraceae bacterium]
MKRSRKDVTMIAAIAAMLLFAVFNFVFKPQRTELSGAKSNLQGVEQNISDAELKLQAPTTTTTATDADSPAAQPAIPEDPALTQLLRQLQAVAGQNGVTYAAITPSPLSENPSGPGGSMLISITASGPHDGVQAYLQGLRDLDRLLVIEQIAITAPPAVAGQPQQPDQLQLSIRVFTLQPPATIPPAIPTATPAP